VSDSTRYSITRKGQPRVSREELDRSRKAAEVEPLVPSLETSRLAQGSRPSMDVPTMQRALQGLPGTQVKVEFGDVELIIEHRLDEVSIILPGALRLTAPRAQAMALVAALMKRP
jgi:hypothetical protein